MSICCIINRNNLIIHSIEFLDDSVEVSNFDVEQQGVLVQIKLETANPSLKGKGFVYHIVE